MPDGLQKLIEAFSQRNSDAIRTANTNTHQPLEVASNQEASPFSPVAVDLIKRSEGFEATAYKDYNSRTQPMTIGYGHAGPNVQPGDTITEADAEFRLMDDMKDVSKQIEALVKVPLNRNQKSALVSFVYNVGSGNFQSSTLLKKLNEGNYAKAAGEFDKWVFGARNGRKAKLPGLITRRANERRLFETY